MIIGSILAVIIRKLNQYFGSLGGWSEVSKGDRLTLLTSSGWAPGELRVSVLTCSIGVRSPVTSWPHKMSHIIAWLIASKTRLILLFCQRQTISISNILRTEVPVNLCFYQRVLHLHPHALSSVNPKSSQQLGSALSNINSNSFCYTFSWLATLLVSIQSSWGQNIHLGRINSACCHHQCPHTRSFVGLKMILMDLLSLSR